MNGEKTVIPKIDRPKVLDVQSEAAVEVSEQVELTSELKNKIDASLTKLLEVVNDPVKLFKPRTVENINQEKGEIKINLLGLLIDIFEDTNLEFSQIIEYLKQKGKHNEFKIKVDKEDGESYLVIYDAQDFLKKKGEERKEKIDKDFVTLLELVIKRMKELDGKRPGLLGSDYFVLRGRVKVRKFPKEVQNLIYVMDEKKDEFKKMMEDAGYKDPFFGSENDGDRPGSWLELSWEES